MGEAIVKYRLTFTATLFDDDEATTGHEVVLKQLGELMADMGERYLIEVDTVAFDGWEADG